MTSRILDQTEFSGKVRLADFIELMIYAFPGIPFTTTKLHNLLSGIWGIEIHHLELAQVEMKRRAEIIGNAYPFIFSSGVPVNRVSTNHYLALLTLSHVNKISSDDLVLNDASLTKAFEEITEICLSDFYGAQTMCVNFGFPSKIGRPPEFGQAITWLAQKIGIQSGTSFRSPRRKDGGVDLVVWKSFGDSRSGIPILLVQATIQRDIRAKSRDVDRRMWSGWLSMDVDPLVAISVPYVLEQSEAWNEVTRNCLVLDRVRMSTILVRDPTPIPKILEDTVETFKKEFRAIFQEYIL